MDLDRPSDPYLSYLHLARYTPSLSQHSLINTLEFYYLSSFYGLNISSFMFSHEINIMSFQSDNGKQV